MLHFVVFLSTIACLFMFRSILLYHVTSLQYKSPFGPFAFK